MEPPPLVASRSNAGLRHSIGFTVQILRSTFWTKLWHWVTVTTLPGEKPLACPKQTKVVIISTLNGRNFPRNQPDPHWKVLGTSWLNVKFTLTGLMLSSLMLSVPVPPDSFPLEMEIHPKIGFWLPACLEFLCQLNEEHWNAPMLQGIPSGPPADNLGLWSPVEAGSPPMQVAALASVHVPSQTVQLHLPSNFCSVPSGQTSIFPPGPRVPVQPPPAPLQAGQSDKTRAGPFG